MQKDAFFQLFLSELADVYSAEKQLVEFLPEVVKMVTASDLREAISKHLEETRNQVRRLEKIFQAIKEQETQKVCEAMQGLIREARSIVKQQFPSAVRDAAIICGAQKIEHYEIATYGTLVAFADQLDLDSQIKDLLQDSLDEEAAANKKLTSIAEGGFFTTGINQRAVQQ